MSTAWEKHLVTSAWLQEQISGGKSDIRIVDMRGTVKAVTSTTGEQTAEYHGAFEEYQKGHIPGAIYLDWTSDIADIEDPIPAQAASPEKIEAVLSAVGIGNNTEVIAYDSHPSLQFATRLWWLLNYYGHTCVRVLQGGWSGWLDGGHPISQGVTQHLPAVFTPVVQPEMRTTAEQILQSLNQGSSACQVIIDARDEGQFTGKIRRGARGGHIPGAVNIPREAICAASGQFKTEAELKHLFASLLPALTPDSTAIAYCNGGVAATAVLFALSIAGHNKICNYDGSWNEWNLRSELPIEQG